MIVKRNDFVCFNNDSDLKKKLFNHFFSSCENAYIFDNNKLLGVIKFKNFINNLNDIRKSIEEVKLYSSGVEIKDGFIVMSNGKIVFEYKEVNSTGIKDRFDDLYKENDKINNYLRSLKIKKIAVFGSFSEKIHNFIDMYGNDFETIICSTIEELYDNLDEDTLIIDTDSDITVFKKYIVNAYNLINVKEINNVRSLDEICEMSEYYYFINTILKNKEINVSVLEFPDISEFENLTDEEKFRIAFDHHYRYYYDRYKSNKYIDNILRNVFGTLYSDEFIESRNHMPNVYLKSGRLFLEDSNNPYCSSKYGKRTTTGQNINYNFHLNVFGPCLVFGPLVDDESTICSYLQAKINNYGYDYQVNNYGARAIGFVENIRTFDAIALYKNDYCLFFVNCEEKDKLISLGFDNFIKLKDVFNNPNLKNYFIDEPVHCNHIANSKIAEFTFEQIKNKLIRIDKANEEIATPLIIPKLRNVFKDNNYLKEYLEFLKQFKNNEINNGCIVMNCNPFTYGHYRLIEHASKEVDTLYVFVVQEDKSYFDFKTRYEMVMEGCSKFSNVVVIPSGKLLASVLLFPAYFNKEENQTSEIDVSLDRDLFAGYIAPLLNIKVRYLGEENFDLVTSAYNKDLKNNLPLYGIKVSEIPRYCEGENEISAKVVRKALEDENWDLISRLVPETTVKILKKRREK